MTVNILGTKYAIIKKKYAEDKAFADRNIDGYCSAYDRRIVVCDMTTYPGWEKESAKVIKVVEAGTLRHEIVHAFLNESGLRDSSAQYNGGWANFEEMVDWIAIQFPKMQKAFEQAGCL